MSVADPPLPSLSPDASLPVVRRLDRLALNVRDLDRSVAFYAGALDATMVARSATGVRLAVGAQRIELVQRADARPYPEPRAANDPWFQHFAIAVADMAAAHARLVHHDPEPITRGGPQLLPPSTGSVTAYKFRDPDGHPLELSHAPASDWSRAPHDGKLFLGIDHSALAVGDLDASIAFYTRLGFRLGTRSLNQGPEQARLDGLDGATVAIATLLTPDPGLHIELLQYRSPAPQPARDLLPGDIAATETVLARSDRVDLSQLTDPDGHLLRFTSSQ